MHKVSLLLAFLTSFIASSQEFYILNLENQIYTYEYSTGAINFVVEVNYPTGIQITDIAYADADHFYGIDVLGAIINIDLVTGDYTTVFQLPSDLNFNGLVYNSNNQLVAITNTNDSRLITIDLNTNTIVSEIFIGTGNSGDITYYKGNLLFQGVVSGSDILAYDGTTVKSVACFTSTGLWGIANYITSCDSNLVLAFDAGGEIWEYDIEGQTYELIDTASAITGGLGGATTVNEQNAYNCDLVDLEEVNCKLMVDEYVFICEYNNATKINSIQYLDTSNNLYHLFDIDLVDTILLDIAFSSEGLLYGITDDQEIIEIFGDGTFEVVAEITGVEGYNGLVGDASNQLLLMGSTESKILTFDIANGTIGSEIEIPEGSPGDATFYRGNLLYPGVSGDFYAYDGVESKTVLCNEIIPFSAIANRFGICSSFDIIAITEGGVLYEYQVQGNIGLSYERDYSTQVGVVFGAANRLEYMASECPLIPISFIDCELGVTELKQSELNLYPNPANDVVYLSAPEFEEALFYELYSLEGKFLEEGMLDTKLQIQQLSAGVYFLKLYNVAKTILATKKFIKN